VNSDVTLDGEVTCDGWYIASGTAPESLIAARSANDSLRSPASLQIWSSFNFGDESFVDFRAWNPEPRGVACAIRRRVRSII
jgi:hypothetical protein